MSKIDQYCDRSSKSSQQNPKHKKDKLTTYDSMVGSCKTARLEETNVCRLPEETSSRQV